MKKVGILTMQKVKNHGSFLQAYALMSCIKQLSESEVVFVDFMADRGIVDPCKETFEKLRRKKIKYLTLKIITKTTAIPGIGKMLLKNRKIKTWKNMFSFFDLYCKRYEKHFWKLLPMSNTVLSETGGLDLLIIGSDEVFNFSINEKVGYSDELFAHGSKAKHNISFSACFGCSSLEDLRQDGREEKLKKYLSRFDDLSMRDKNSLKIACYLLGEDRDIAYHLDPVFYYDFKNELPDITKKRPYIAVYSYTGLKEEEKSAIQNFANVKDLDIYCFLGYQGEFGTFMNVSPFEVLAYIKNADYVVSTTFHGCVFATKFNKQFCAVTQKKLGEYGNEEKLGDLLNRLHLSNRAINNFSELNEIMDSPIDYTKANQYIENSTREALQYLGKYL